jgi:hypothetical protein
LHAASARLPFECATPPPSGSPANWRN